MWSLCLQGFCSRTWSSNVDQITEVRARYFSKSKLLQRTMDQSVDLVETQMMDHVEIKMPKISSQDSVEAVKIVLQERISERMCDQIGVVEVPDLSRQESVEAIKIANF